MKHGTNSMYTVGKCRCQPCREAGGLERKAWALRALSGTPRFVPAAPIRERVAKLRALGMSLNEIERAANLDDKVLEALLVKHWRTGKPVTRILRTNAEAILGIRYRALEPGSVVPSDKAWGWMLEIMALGYSKTWIAERVGKHPRNLNLHNGRPIHYSLHLRMLRLWKQTAERAPETTKYERQSASRSRNYAARMMRNARHRGHYAQRKAQS